MKKTFHNSLHLFFFVPLIFFFQCSNSSQNIIKISEDNAPSNDTISVSLSHEIVLNKIMDNITHDKLLFYFDSILPPNYPIKNHFDTTIEYTLSSGSFRYYLIDDNPEAFFAKPVRYALVNIHDGSHKVFDENYFPSHIFLKMDTVHFNLDNKTRQKAIQYVKEQVLPQISVSPIELYITPFVIHHEGVIKNQFFNRHYSYGTRSLFFLIDEAPGGYYAKPVKYLILDENCTTYKLIDEQWFPHLYWAMEKITL